MDISHPNKVQIIELVNRLLNRSGLTIDRVVARMQTHGCDISRSSFENQFTTRAGRKPNIPPEYVLGLIAAFTERLTDCERCTAAEAVELARLASLPIDRFGMLKRFFLEPELLAALRLYVPIFASSSLTEALPNPTTAIGQSGYHLPENWREFPEVALFVGRQPEQARLIQWILGDHCRLVGVLGAGGIGKSALVAKLVELIADQFDHLFWYSLLNAPPLDDILQRCIQQFCGRSGNTLSRTIEQQISLLLKYFGEARCLLVLDNMETLLRSGDPDGQFRPGYEAYGRLLHRLGTDHHQSCLLLTGREKPTELARLEEENNLARLLHLTGLTRREGQAILKESSLTGINESWTILIDRYQGNPLALKLAAGTIRQRFAGDVSRFLAEERLVTSGIQEVLTQQLDRLSTLEAEIVYWLAINREPTGLETLQEDIVGEVSVDAFWTALESLQRRFMIERASSNSFTLQPMVMEYTTERFVERICREIKRAAPALWMSHALIKAQAKTYVRHSQTRLILEPVAEKLLATLGPDKLEERIDKILSTLREQSPRFPSYGAGNALNLLSFLKRDLSGRDFSGLAVWQADLQQVILPDVNFAEADLSKSVFTDNFGGVLSAAFSPDNRLLAVGANEVRLWQISDGHPLITCYGHTDWVWSVTFSSDGNLLASGSVDRTIRLWDVHTGQCLHTLSEHQGWVRSVAFSPDSCLLASVGDDQTVRLWDVSTGRCLQTLLGHTDRIWSVTFSPDGRFLASGGEDQTIRLWDVHTGQHVGTLLEHTGWVVSMAFSPEGDILASGSNDQTVRLWDVRTGQCLRMMHVEVDLALSIAFSPDGRKLACGSFDQAIYLWDVSSGQCLQTLQGHSFWIRAVAFSPDGQILASVSDDQTVRLWEVHTGQCLKVLQGYTNRIWSVRFSVDGQTLASGGVDRAVHLWDVRTGRAHKTLRGHTNWIMAVAFSPAGGILASGSTDQTVRLWDVGSGQCLKVLQGHTRSVVSVAFNPDDDILASGSEDQTIRLWNARSGQCLRILHGHTGWVWPVTFSSEGNILASGSVDQTVRLWDVRTGQCIRTLAEHTNTIWSLAFSPDGAILASGCGDRTIRLWDVSTGQLLKTLKGPGKLILAIAFSADGRTLASGSNEQVIRLWNVATGQCAKILSGHTNWVFSVAFSPTSNLLASGSYDETIRLWDAQTGECLKTLSCDRPYERMNITGVTGLTKVQKATLKTLGAIEITN